MTDEIQPEQGSEAPTPVTGLVTTTATVPVEPQPTTPNLSDEQPGTSNVLTGTVQPVHVDGRNIRTDDDAVLHSFVNIVDGEHKGRMGAFERVLKFGEDGWPTQALVRTRDEFNELLAVPYKHLRPSGFHGGR